MSYHQNPISFIYTFYFKHELPAPVLGLVAIKIYTYHLVYLFIMGKRRGMIEIILLVLCGQQPFGLE